MKAGLLGLLVVKSISFVGTLILIFMLMIAVVGPKPAATLAGTTAVIGGQSTGVVFGTLPSFFRSIKEGQSLVTPSTGCTSLTGCAAQKTAGGTSTPKAKTK